MTNKEILAELKQSYEYLCDIRENGSVDHCDGQMKHDNIESLEIAINNIEKTYYNFYRTLDKEKLRVKYLEKQLNTGEKVYIAENVYEDYEVGINYDSLTCIDLDYFWYENNKFENDFLNDY